MRHKIALVRFYFGKDPKDLTLDEFLRLEAELVWLSSIGALNVKFEG